MHSRSVNWNYKLIHVATQDKYFKLVSFCVTLNSSVILHC